MNDKTLTSDVIQESYADIIFEFKTKEFSEGELMSLRRIFTEIIKKMDTLRVKYAEFNTDELSLDWESDAAGFDFAITRNDYNIKGRETYSWTGQFTKDDGQVELSSTAREKPIR